MICACNPKQMHLKEDPRVQVTNTSVGYLLEPICANFYLFYFKYQKAGNELISEYVSVSNDADSVQRRQQFWFGLHEATCPQSLIVLTPQAETKRTMRLRAV